MVRRVDHVPDEFLIYMYKLCSLKDIAGTIIGKTYLAGNLQLRVYLRSSISYAIRYVGILIEHFVCLFVGTDIHVVALMNGTSEIIEVSLTGKTTIKRNLCVKDGRFVSSFT